VAPLIAARALDPGITLPSPASVTSMSVSDATPNVDPMASAPTAASVAAAPPPLVTYDASAPEVTPPVPVLPRLLGGLRPTSPGVRLDALKIAVVVNGDGTTESVSGVTRPENMGEYVLLTAALSAVKGWQFTPAMKDGVPVRYRLVVPLRHVTSSTP
jgi:hypothetical protein